MKTLKVSEIVTELVKLQAQHGDVPVIIIDTADNEFPIRKDSLQMLKDGKDAAIVLG